MRASIRILALASVASALIFALCTPVGAMAAPGPAWQILQSTFPTELVPGTEVDAITSVPEYELFITNVGGGAASGTVVTDVLPAGITSSSIVAPKFEYGLRSRVATGSETGPCQVSGQVITCTISVPILPGTSVLVKIPLAVGQATASTVENEVTVEGGGGTASKRLATSVGTALPSFGLLPGAGLFAGVSDDRGAVPPAGSHPFLVTFNVGVPNVSTGGAWSPVQSMRRVGVGLPQGLVVDPLATTDRCSQQVLEHQAVTNPSVYCPQSSQVGVVYPVGSGTLQHIHEPIYNVEPPPGSAAALAFSIENATAEILGGVDGGFHLTAKSTELIAKFHIGEVAIVLWGVPSDAGHDATRFGGEETSVDECVINGCAIEPSPAPFVTMPTSCTEPTTVSGTVESWQGSFASATSPLTDKDGRAASIAGCNQLAFEPTIRSNATTNQGESPSGLEFRLHQRQDESLEGRSTAALKDATVTLPEGMILNPAAATGLASCTEAEMDYAPTAEGKIQFETTPQTCPDAAKVGTVGAGTPLLEQELNGSIYVAKPFDNPFGSLLAVYLAIEDEETGIVVKLAGKVEPNPTTGQLTATFEENPELPVEDISLHFFAGERGVLTTPLTCGTQTTSSALTPWSTPEGADAHPTDSFQIVAGCSASEAAAPKSVSFTAGTESPLSGAYSPFILRLSRPDGSQHITGLETTLPEGLLGKLAGVSYCPESGIAQARSRETHEKGKEEQSSPSCPSSSEVGTVNVTAGSGTSPILVSGHAFLAGPYKGAPLSLVVIVPAVAGPFDLGTVVDRVALNVGEYDARIHAVADPLPRIRDGIPLDVRSIELKLDRPSFTLNPTSCEVSAIEGSVSTQAGQTQALSNRFQVGECGRLAFKPKLAISLKGPTKRAGHPALRAVVTYPKQGAYANIARAQVNLPHSEFLDQGNIGKTCTKPLLAARACPAKSIYGKAKAWSPLLAAPLEGPVYLVGGYGYKLPALVAELDGQIRVLLVGKVDTGKNHGIRNTFEAVPDAPVSRFVLEMKGGKKYGLLVNSEDICKKPQKAGVAFRAQNGRKKSLTVKISNSCKGKKADKTKRKG
jgi:hypothetical protein